MTFRPQVIVYHHPCSDGAASAALLADFYGNDGSIQWIRGNYSNTQLLDDIVAATAGKTVLFVDFSLKADAMQHLQTVAKTIVVLDHHDSALREFAKLGDVISDPLTADNFNVNATYADGFYAFMRMDMSGVGLTYRWLYGFDNPLPKAVELTQAIDLGKDHTDTAAVDMASFKWYSRSLPTDVETLHNTHEYAAKVLLQPRVSDTLYAQGQAIKQFVDLCVNQYVEQAQIVEYTVDEVTYTIPTAFASYAFASDVASKLIYERDGGKYNMAVCVYFNENGLGLSLRSKNGVECNAVAESFGGGGHKQAAGVNVAWPDVIEFVQNIVATITVQEAQNDS